MDSEGQELVTCRDGHHAGAQRDEFWEMRATCCISRAATSVVPSDFTNASLTKAFISQQGARAKETQLLKDNADNSAKRLHIGVAHDGGHRRRKSAAVEGTTANQDSDAAAVGWSPVRVVIGGSRSEASRANIEAECSDLVTIMPRIAGSCLRGYAPRRCHGTSKVSRRRPREVRPHREPIPRAARQHGRWEKRWAILEQSPSKRRGTYRKC